MAGGGGSDSEHERARLRACTSDIKAADQMTAERSTCDALGLLHPSGCRFRIWNGLVHVLVMWSSFWATFEFAFLASPSQGVLYFDGAVCLLFLVNVVLTFNAAYRCSKSLRLITSKRQIALRYACGGLALDLLSSIPCNLIYFWAHGEPASGALGYVFRGLVCLRLYRVAHFYHALSLLGRSNRPTYFAIRIFKLVLNIVLLSHLFAVAYFFLTLMEPDPENTWIGQGIGPDWPEQTVFLQYVAAMWWSIFVITSIGPAYTSVTTAEQIFSSVYALFGMATLAYTLGTLTMLMVKQSSKTMQFHEDMASLKAYAARTNLPSDLQRQLKQQLRVQLQMHKSDTSSFLSSIPHHLRVTVSRQLYLPIIENLDGFCLCSKPFLHQLVSEMDVETVMRNDIVTSEGDVAAHLYIVLSGKLVREDGPAAALNYGGSSFLSAGSVFGKTAVMCNVPQLFTVRALEHSQLLRLSKSAFSAIAKAYPADSAVLFSALKQNIGPAALVRTPSELAVSQGLARSTPTWMSFTSTPEEDAVAEGAEGAVKGGGDFAGKGAAATIIKVEMAEGGDTAGLQPDTDAIASVCAAASAGNAHRLQQLLHSAPQLARAHDYNGRTPLHVAAAYGHVACINVLLQNEGVDVNAADRGGSTPLLEAVKNGHSKAAQALQAAGAALLLKDPGATLCQVAASAAAAAAAAATAGGSASAAAATGTDAGESKSAANATATGTVGCMTSGSRKVVCSPTGSSSGGSGDIETGVPIKDDSELATPTASKSGGSSVEYLERLLAAGADVNAQDHAGCTALHVACANRSIAVAKILLSHGANPHLEDASVTTPYDIAKASLSPHLLSLLEGST
ncbi:hypothetical protein CLOM_g7326 [Closterium sp. NIES-68]|nr:hypothetical protein CLOM_g7326 [Closterium sp. NIES-68]